MVSDRLVLSVDNLQTNFQVGNQEISVVRGVSFAAKAGQTLAIVGESGCGKSVTVHSVMQLLPKNGKIVGGKVTFYGSDKVYELTSLKPFGKEMRSVRGTRIGMVFQDPMASLNPVYKVGDQVAENLLQHSKMTKKQARERIVEMFASLGIPDPERRVDDYPHQFSGGMKQRVMIAIAMICNPDLLIADEPTTALDVTIQAQIMELIGSLKAEKGKSIILITHNMGLVAENADEVAVMYMGRIVEQGSVEQIFHEPCHPYTKALLRSVPVLGRGRAQRLETIGGSTPSPSECVEGCEFANRCEYVSPKCWSHPIPSYEVEDNHLVRCVLFATSEDKR
ncbi:MAG TPA: ABC transporter ATP-binding protein [Spirochaetales bacterium]|nr:ABC transporter ATP-binding protein [Spirochaetales bacterium]